MKKLLALVAVLAMALAICAGCGGDTQKEPAQQGNAGGDKVIKIGIFEPASGENGPGGKQEVLGVRYAHSLQPNVEINGETYKVELVEVDNQSDTTKAVSAAQNLVASNVSVILGSYGSGVAIAGGDTFKTAQIPAIGISCTNPQVTEGNDYYFRVCFLDPFQGTVMANFAKDEMNAETAFVITQLGDDYSAGLGTYFKQAFEGLGGTVLEAQFQTGETDFNAILTNVLNSDADVIFAPSSIQTAPLLIRQAREMGITIPILAGDTWENESIILNAGDKATEVYLSTFFDENDTSNPAAAEFVSGFKAWLNADQQNLTNNGGGLCLVLMPMYTSSLKVTGLLTGADIKLVKSSNTYSSLNNLEITCSSGGTIASGFKVVLKGEIGVAKRLGLDALRGVDDEQGAFAGGERA